MACRRRPGERIRFTRAPAERAAALPLRARNASLRPAFGWHRGCIRICCGGRALRARPFHCLKAKGERKEEGGSTAMRIAMISTPFLSVPPREYGGTELVVHELTEGLIERGHDVTLFATGDSQTSAELKSLYPQAQWPPELLTDLNHVSWAMQKAKEGDFDVIHGHSA